jgi:hypothetical protein
MATHIHLPLEEWVVAQRTPLRAAWSRVRDCPAFHGLTYEDFCQVSYKLSSGKVHEFDLPGEDKAVEGNGSTLHRSQW